jgi:hypothetical protein
MVNDVPERELVKRLIAAVSVITVIDVRGPVEAMVRHLAPLMGDGVTVRYLSPLLTVRGAVIATAPGRPSWLISAGVNGDTAKYLVEGWLSNDGMSRSFGCNTNSYTDALRVISPAIAAHTPEHSEVWYFGHSGGGSVVEAAARVCKTLGRNTVGSIMTIGSPMPGLPLAAVNDEDVIRYRCMNRDDPVPLLPYLELLSRESSVMLSSVTGYRPWECSHGRGGSLLNEDGSASPSYSGSGALGTRSGSVAIWIAGIDENVGSPHKSESYLSRLISRYNLLAPLAPADVSGPQPARTQASPLLLEMALRSTPDSSELCFGFLDPKNGEVTMPEPLPEANDRGKYMPQAKVPKRLRATFESFAGTHTVVLADRVVCHVAEAGQARVIASAINRLYRVLGNSNLINGGPLITSLQATLTACSIPGTGSSPPLAVV